MHLVEQSRQIPRKLPDKNRLENANEAVPRVAGLRVDFVAKPDRAEDMDCAVNDLLVRAELYREGLQSAVLLVSDRESRLVTLLTFWDAARFERSRERLTSWTLKLVSSLADGSLRANSSVARFLDLHSSAKLTLADLRPEEIAELVDIANSE